MRLMGGRERMCEQSASDGALGALVRMMREGQAGEIWASLGAWVTTADARLGGRTPEIGWDVAPRVAWARETATAPGYAEGAALRDAARAEVRVR